MTPVGVRLQRAFTPDDQKWFAALSGDCNPMHMDPIAARRTPAGEPAVHGVHTLLWALETIAALHPDLAVPSALRVDFASFLVVGRTATLGELKGEGNRRATVFADGLAIMTVELRFGSMAAALDTNGVPSDAPLPDAPDTAVVLNLKDIAAQAGAVAFASAPGMVQDAFPRASAWLGRSRVGALMASTRLVGMVCPGLHSIFNRIDVNLHEFAGDADQLRYAVAGVDPRFRRVKLSVSGGGIAGTLVTSVRNPPVRQSDIAALAGIIDPNSFRGSRALVIGGSRGLGELTAKILAVGGADVVITYARGQADAERVAQEVIEWGGTCRAISYDAHADARAQLGDQAGRITHCYYYATSPIFVPSASIFEKARFDRFNAIYVNGFFALCDALGAGTERRIGIFYPSSVAVEDRPPGMSEYAMAKAAGELLCDEINRRQKAIRVIMSRLPRLATDQTATLFAEEAVSTLDVILPLVRQVQAVA